MIVNSNNSSNSFSNNSSSSMSSNMSSNRSNRSKIAIFFVLRESLIESWQGSGLVSLNFGNGGQP
jgi:hypothetical protein